MSVLRQHSQRRIPVVLCQPLHSGQRCGKASKAACSASHMPCWCNQTPCEPLCCCRHTVLIMRVDRLRAPVCILHMADAVEGINPAIPSQMLELCVLPQHLRQGGPDYCVHERDCSTDMPGHASEGQAVQADASSSMYAD